MYAIVFDLDTNTLEAIYRNPSWRNAYVDIGNCLAKHGFERQQGSTYFGNETVDAVRCVIAVQELTKTYDCFSPAVRDVRMLRIEDNNDLRPAIDALTRT
ncbi:virulence factor [Sandaracinobacteroides hominis]|uniref:virulence factor n=1 Tax=Sandaracinobacteroides hominis TaxID=2780086 RepID=UPI001F470037|nr:virulence factor [Sandaracinobacteroides hominis]